MNIQNKNNKDKFLIMESNEEKKLSLQEQDSTKLLSINSKLYAEPESHLQSLGFIINNGKARFKLDEEASLYSKAAISNFCDVDSDDSLSFVVLGKDSLNSIQQSSLASYVDIQQKCMSVDYNSMIASWDTAEVHQKLNELLQENTKLKETLKQNNIAMKQQFNVLATWQEEIMRVHQNHKKKFAETRELINYLKKENTELKMKLASGLTSYTETGCEFLDISERQNDTKEKKISSFESEFSKSVLHELESILNENSDKSMLASKTATSTQKIPELDKQNDDKQLLEGERIAFNKEKEMLEEEKKLLDNRKKNLDLEYKNLNDAKALLQQERIGLQEEQTSLDQQSQLYEMQYKKTLETEKKKFEVKYDQLIAELGIMHQSVEKKESRMKELENDLTRHKEDIILLQTQLKLYEEDFRHERKLKETLLEEKNALNADLRKQIEFNDRLQEQINSLYPIVPGNQNRTTELQPPLLSSFSCPKFNIDRYLIKDVCEINVN